MQSNLVRRSLSAQGNFFILNGVAIAATGRASGGGGGGRKYNNVMHAFSVEEKKIHCILCEKAPPLPPSEGGLYAQNLHALTKEKQEFCDVFSKLR